MCRSRLPWPNAQYDATAASYRNTVLTSFQEVEDNLAALRILSRELEQQNEAVASAQRALTLAMEQATLLNNQRTAVNLQAQQMTASVELIKALGGGWTRPSFRHRNSSSEYYPQITQITPS